jgi:hypothetical protein
MLDLILKMLEVDDFVGRSKNIDIAKGSNKLPMSLNEAWKQRKRMRAWL